MIDARVQAQNARPKPRTHAELFEPIEKLELAQARLNGKTGKPLTEAERAQFADARKLVESGRQAIDKGELDAARKDIDTAFSQLSNLVDQNNYLLITTIVHKNMLDAASSQKTVASQTAIDAARCVKLVEDGKYAEAIQLADKVVAAVSKLPPAFLPLAATAIFEKGDAYLNLSDYEAASESIERAVALTQRIYGSNHPEYAKTRDKLGWSMMHEANRGEFDREKLQEAADAINSAVTILQATTGDSQETAESLDNLGTILFQLRKIPQAVNAKLRALAIRKKVLPADHLDMGVSYSNLGWLYGRLPETLAEAVPMRKAALDVFRKNLRADHPWLLLEESNLAYDYYRMGQLDDAIALYEKIVARDKDSDSASRFDVVQRSALLGSAYVAAGQIDKGIAQMDETFEAAKKAYKGGFEQQAIVALRDLANSARQASLLEPSRKYFKQLVAWMREQSKDPKDPDPAIRAVQYGGILVDTGKYDEAIALLTEAIAELKRIKGSGDQQLINAYASIARAYLAQGKADDALPHCDAALQITEAKTGSESVLTAYALMLQARANTAAGSTTLAEFSFKSALEIFDKEPPPDPPGLIRTRIEYGKCLLQMEQGEKARSQFDTALKLCRDLMEKNPDNINIKSITASVLAAMTDGATKLPDVDPDQANKWKAEAVGYLKEVKARRALVAEDEDWLAKHD